MPLDIYQWRPLRMFHAAALALVAGAAMAQDLSVHRYPITNRDIAEKLSIIGISVDATQVSLPVLMSATSTSPTLEIITAQPLAGNQVRLELRCRAVVECLPFFAIVNVQNAASISAEIRLKARSTTVTGHQTASPMGSPQADQLRLKVGARAMLTIREGHLDIHLQVLAVDSGAIGQNVRVCTLDRKKVFHATVTGEGTVTGVME